MNNVGEYWHPPENGDKFFFSEDERKADERLLVKFIEEPYYMAYESEQQGKPVYENRVFIYVHGDSKSVHPEEVNEYWKAKFPKHWEAFEKQRRPCAEGTPIEELAFLNAGKRATYKAMNIVSVEQLAATSDADFQKMGMGAREDAAKAKAYLERAKDQASTNKIVSENERLKGEMDALQKQFLTLQQQVLEGAKAPTEEPKAAEDDLMDDIKKTFGED